MRSQTIIFLILFSILLTACSPESSSPNAAPTDFQNSTQNHSNQAGLPENSPTSEPGLAETDCFNGTNSPIGQSIADSFENTSYEQVVTWFCSGAEYEDILVALETETLTETPAEEMLQMLAEGLTWEEIWYFVGIE